MWLHFNFVVGTAFVFGGAFPVQDMDERAAAGGGVEVQERPTTRRRTNNILGIIQDM